MGFFIGKILLFLIIIGAICFALSLFPEEDKNDREYKKDTCSRTKDKKEYKYKDDDWSEF